MQHGHIGLGPGPKSKHALSISFVNLLFLRSIDIWCGLDGNNLLILGGLLSDLHRGNLHSLIFFPSDVTGIEWLDTRWGQATSEKLFRASNQASWGTGMVKLGEVWTRMVSCSLPSIHAPLLISSIQVATYLCCLSDLDEKFIASNVIAWYYEQSRSKICMALQFKTLYEEGPPLALGFFFFLNWCCNLFILLYDSICSDTTFSCYSNILNRICIELASIVIMGVNSY